MASGESGGDLYVFTCCVYIVCVCVCVCVGGGGGGGGELNSPRNQ